MPEDAAIQIGLLGPLEVRVGDRAVAIARPKQRALLAVLALSPGVCVPRERLADELWGERPPESAAHALQVHVSGLRKLIGAELVATCPGGYRLDAPAAAVDAVRASELVAAGRRDGDAAALAEALELFRGEPLQDVELEGPAAREAARLSGLRAEALEERFELALAAGEGASLVAPLERLVAEEPLRERPRAQLMLALYRAGRQADALAAFQAARRTFVDELGIDPSPALREMERAILQQDAALLVAPGVVATPPPERRRRRRIVLAVLAGLLAAAAGALAAVFLPPSDPRAADATTARSTPATHAVSTVVATPVMHHTARKPKRARHTATLQRSARPVTHAHVVTHARVVTHPAPTTTTPPRVIPPATIPARPPVTTTKRSPPVTTHPIATTTAPAPTTTAPSGPEQIADSFDAPTPDPSVWNVFLNGTGANVVQRNGKLVITISPGAKPGGSYNFVGGQYGTKACYSGDIDMQVDYQLLEWPPGTGAYVGLNAIFANAMVEVMAQTDSTNIYGSMIDPYWTNADASGTSGSLRLTRVDGVVTTYYLANGAWQQLDSKPASKPAHLHIGLSLMPGLSASSEIQVALDNFSATASGATAQGC